MRERAAELGGICTITNKPGRGTQVTAKLPLQLAYNGNAEGG
jgi:signal transduction histidine kinase